MQAKVCAFVVALCMPLLAPAQITTGTISGRVIDSSGGAIAGANVILVSEQRGRSLTLQADIEHALTV